MPRFQVLGEKLWFKLTCDLGWLPPIYIASELSEGRRGQGILFYLLLFTKGLCKGKSKDVSLETKAKITPALVVPITTYRCES